MTNYLRHQYELLQLSLKIVEFTIEQNTWKEINDEENVRFYQEKINSLKQQRELYLNNLLRSLNKTTITQQTALEIKKTYELVEEYSSNIYSQLFKAHLNKTIEKHQKQHSDYLVSNQLRKAIEIEKTIDALEGVA